MATIIRNEDLVYQEDQNAMENYRLWTAHPGISHIAGAKNLFFDLRMLQPGKFSFPYHFHRHAEEIMLIISGTMTLRTEEGLNILKTGDRVFFEMGKNGAHQFHNHSDTPCTYLDIRTIFGVDICEYPDSGKVNILPAFEVFKVDSKVDYFEGEHDPMQKWNELKQDHP